MSKLNAIPYTQFFTGDAERFATSPSPYPMPKGIAPDVERLLDKDIKFGVKAYRDGKATRVFTYRNHDHNDVVEVIDIFKGSSNEDIDYAHRRLVHKTTIAITPFSHEGKSA